MAILNLLNQLRVGAAVLRLIQDPTQTQQVFRVADLGLKMKDRKALHAALDYALAQPNFRMLLQERYLPEPIDLNKLLRLPEGTLGNEFARHMRLNNLELSFYPDLDATSPLFYFEKRARQCHDVWHVLLGYGTDVKGELELQGFTLGNARIGLSAVIIAAGIFHVLKERPAEIFDYFEAIVAGFKRGRNAEFLLGVPLESMWNQPIEEIRRRVRVMAD